LHFINFNGTAGVWRKQCILDAGNWESDTLTEDLDLSYRAQLKLGFKYLENVVTLNYQPLSVLRDPNSLDGIKELKTSVKMPLAYSIKVYWIENKAHGI
jgi:cellulose synthase/poly-beta-1,6-N-acetylglucosamine synthase-like glycosyltransferase